MAIQPPRRDDPPDGAPPLEVPAQPEPPRREPELPEREPPEREPELPEREPPEREPPPPREIPLPAREPPARDPSQPQREPPAREPPLPEHEPPREDPPTREPPRVEPPTPEPPRKDPPDREPFERAPPGEVRLRAAWIAAAAIVATWIAALATGIEVRAPSPAELIALGGNWAPRTHDEPWRLLTAAFAHAGALHLALNVAGLVVIGTLAERRLGALATATVMLCATVIASAASLAWSPYSVTVGASGAVAGLTGALVIALLRERSATDTAAPRTERRIAIAAVVAFLAWGSLLAATTDAVDHAAHVGGLLTGAVIALIAAPRAVAATRERSATRGRSGTGGRSAALAPAPPLTRVALAAAIAIGATVAILRIAPRPIDIRALGAQVIAIEQRYDRIIEGVGFRADGPRLAATLEHEILQPLRDTAARLVVDDRLPPRDRRFASALAAYLAARLRALELHNRYLETGDTSVLDAIEAAESEARAAGTGLD